MSREAERAAYRRGVAFGIFLAMVEVSKQLAQGFCPALVAVFGRLVMTEGSPSSEQAAQFSEVVRKTRGVEMPTPKPNPMAN